MVMQQHAAGHRGAAWATARPPSSPSRSSRSRKASTTTRATPTTTCSSWPCRVSRQAAVPQLLLPGRPVQPAVLQARPSGDRGRLHGLPHPGHGQRLRSHPGDHLRPRQPELHLHQPAPHRHQGQRRSWTGSSRSWTARWTWSSTSCWSASKSSAAKKRAQLPLPDGPGRMAGLRQAGPGRRGGRGAQARHPDRRLHRPGGDA